MSDSSRRGLRRILADDGNWLRAEDTRLQTEKRFADCSGPSLEQNLRGQNARVNESRGVTSVSAKVLSWRLSWTTKSCKTL